MKTKFEDHATTDQQLHIVGGPIMKINKHTNVKVSLKIKKRIWNKRVFVSGCTRMNCWVFLS